MYRITKLFNELINEPNQIYEKHIILVIIFYTDELYLFIL